MLFKLFNVLFCLVFILFAAFQYNDPDPYLWMPIYLYAAVLCALAVKYTFNPVAYLTGLLFYLVYAGYLFFTQDGVLDWINQHQSENIAQTMKATRPWIEDTREFFGLIIIITVLLINFFYLRNRLKSQITGRQTVKTAT
ncbi:MAG: transmembrane 220 family protein [Chitinophagaceae bacterium]